MSTLRKSLAAMLLALLVALGLAILPPLDLRKAYAGEVTDRFASVSVSINSEATLITPTSGKRLTLRSMQVSLSAGSAGVVVFKDGTGGTTIASVFLEAQKNPITITFGRSGKRLSAADHVLTGTLSGGTLTATFDTSEE